VPELVRVLQRRRLLRRERPHLHSASPAAQRRAPLRLTAARRRAEEADAIDALPVVAGRPMRLHTVGDCRTDEAARIVAAAASGTWSAAAARLDVHARVAARRPRELGLRVGARVCETPEQVELARARGYATAIVVEEFATDRLYRYLPHSPPVSRASPVRATPAPASALTGQRPGSEGAPVTSALVLPCPAQTRDDVTCSSCRLCMNDAGLLERGYSIGFEVHGTAIRIRQRDARPPRRRAQESRRVSDVSAIEWTDATWNPVTGCSRVSPGCANCYIERTPPFRMAGRRFEIVGQESTTGVTLHPERLEQPLRWQKPRRVFVCSLADLFHDDVPDEFIGDVWGTMDAARQHVFQVLTKRARARPRLAAHLLRARSRRPGARRAAEPEHVGGRVDRERPLHMAAPTCSARSRPRSGSSAPSRSSARSSTTQGERRPMAVGRLIGG
jgi:hypothetical protein